MPTSYEPQYIFENTYCPDDEPRQRMYIFRDSKNHRKTKGRLTSRAQYADDVQYSMGWAVFFYQHAVAHPDKVLSFRPQDGPVRRYFDRLMAAKPATT